ncbi:MAG: hypothetical protein KAT05_12375 [Spirochaetes bacterium]|nr:hypothetical protein [Spirochaetota bacterium]
MLLKKILILICLFNTLFLFNLEIFKGYSSKDSSSVYSVASLLESKYVENSKWNENYFHEAQFPEQGITIFTNIIFSKAFTDKKGCKFNCTITFGDKKKYTFNQDYGPDEFEALKKGFSIKFGDNFIELKGNNYKIHLENKNVYLDLNYKIVNPPHIFGDGIIAIDKKSYMAFSQPIVGAYISGDLRYKNKNIKLKGRGSVYHDYNVISPIKTPRKWRSFWFYNDKYAIDIHTVILTNGSQIDRITIMKNGKLLKNFLNTGLKTDNFLYDNKTKFSYPTTYSINHTDNDGNKILANINLKDFTDKIQVFEHLSPITHSIVTLAIGEMWAYRFWSIAKFTMEINGKKEVIKMNGIGNYVDIDKQ